MRKIIFLALALLLTANAFAGITLKKATYNRGASSAYFDVYTAYIVPSTTVGTADTVIIYNDTGAAFNLGAMGDTTVIVQFIGNMSSADSSHIKLQYSYSYKPSPTTSGTNIFNYNDWRTVTAVNDSDATNYFKIFSPKRPTALAAAPLYFRLIYFENLAGGGANSGPQTTSPFTIIIAIPKRSWPVNRTLQ